MNATQTTAATIVVRRDDDLTSDMRTAVRSLIARVFSGIDLTDYQSRHRDRVVLAFVEGELAGHVALQIREIEAGGIPVRVVGLGGVATLPEFRGRGIARQVIEVALAEARRDDAPAFALLQCPPDVIEYYTSIGWEHVDAPVFQRVHATLEQVHYPAMVRRLGAERWPAGPIDFRGARW